MKSRLILAALSLMVYASSGSTGVNAQIPALDNKSSSALPAKRKVNIFYSFGSVVLPEGYKGYRTEGFIDAWFGYLESADSSFKIYFRSGLAQSFFDKERKIEYVWTKVETTQKESIKLGLIDNEKNKILVARIGETEFNGVIKDKNDEDIFMEIVRSYQREKCEDCRILPFKSQSK